MLSIVIPCYNEEATISKIIDKIKAVQFDYKVEIIVIDDGSTDNSLDILRQIENIKVIEHGENQGKCSCIQTAIKNVSGDYIIIQDADLEYDPNDIPKVIAPVISNQADAVYGTRQFSNSTSYFTKQGRLITSFLLKILFGYNLKDVNSGYKAFSKKSMENIVFKGKRFTFCVEVTIKLINESKKIIEVPINYYPRGRMEGKKITFKDGIEIFFMMIYLRLMRFL